MNFAPVYRCITVLLPWGWLHIAWSRLPLHTIIEINVHDLHPEFRNGLAMTKLMHCIVKTGFIRCQIDVQSLAWGNRQLWFQIRA